VSRAPRRGGRLRERSGRLYAFKAAGRHANRHSASRTTILTKSRQRRLPPRLTCPVCLVCPVPPRKNHPNAFVRVSVRVLRRLRFILTAPPAEKDFSRHATLARSDEDTSAARSMLPIDPAPRKFRYRKKRQTDRRCSWCNCSPSSRRSRAETKAR